MAELDLARNISYRLALARIEMGGVPGIFGLDPAGVVEGIL